MFNINMMLLFLCYVNIFFNIYVQSACSCLVLLHCTNFWLHGIVQALATEAEQNATVPGLTLLLLFLAMCCFRVMFKPDDFVDLSHFAI